MEDLNKIAIELELHTNSVVKALINEPPYLYNQGKSRAGSTPYASKRKKKRKKRN
nr:MAG TPA: hypothetical protein [Bacteriophage sp.]